jgi:TPR repeat
MFCSLNGLEDAAKEYREAIKLDESFLDARFNLGVTLLGLGQWKEGFEEYEHRWQNTQYPPRAYRYYQKWQGEDLAGKRILLYPEQGYGDEIMALRFAYVVKDRWPDAIVIVQARAPMLRLARQSLHDSIAVVGTHDDSIEAMGLDYSCPLLDVPMVLGMSWQNVIWEKVQAPYNYLACMPADWHHWDRRLADLPPGLNVEDLVPSLRSGKRQCRLLPPERTPARFRTIQICPRDLPGHLWQSEHAARPYSRSLGSLMVHSKGEVDGHAGHVAARVHHALWRCGGVAARGGCAAACETIAHRVSGPCLRAYRR